MQQTPEVQITSRRTGLEMGLAAVTEANRGDFTVRLKPDRSRSIEEVMDDARGQIKSAEPALDIEFTQVLQDMMGTLQLPRAYPDQALFQRSRSAALARSAGTTGDREDSRVVDTQNGVENTISGPATSFQIDPIVAGRLGFTPTEIAEDATSILDGLPTE